MSSCLDWLVSLPSIEAGGNQGALCEHRTLKIFTLTGDVWFKELSVEVILYFAHQREKNGLEGWIFKLPHWWMHWCRDTENTTNLMKFDFCDQVDQDWWIPVKRSLWTPWHPWESNRERTSPQVPKYDLWLHRNSVWLRHEDMNSAADGEKFRSRILIIKSQEWPTLDTPTFNHKYI